MAQRITVNVNGTEKFVGLLEGGVLYVKRSRKKHFYRKLNAYAMDKHLVEEVLPALECKKVQISETDTGRVYVADLETIRRKGLPNNYQGHGAQLFLPLRYWKLEGGGDV